MPRRANRGRPDSVEIGNAEGDPLVGNDVAVEIEADAELLGEGIRGVQDAGAVAAGDEEIRPAAFLQGLEPIILGPQLGRVGRREIIEPAGRQQDARPCR